MDNPDFGENEREYKLQLASSLRRARTTLFDGSRDWFQELRAALNSPEDNIIDWRHRDRMLESVAGDLTQLKAALRRLWAPRRPTHQRFEEFCSYLDGVGFSQKGGQLIVTSTLLMALDGTAYPPIRTRKFEEVLQWAGFDRFAPGDSAAERYSYAIGFLDSIVSEARKRSIAVQDRLDAQGVVWCSLLEIPSSSIDETEEDAVRAIKADSSLTKTEKETLIKARRGQGQFREALLQVWGGCAVTGCTAPSLLRASHLKPWKVSSNTERLASHNGLLLVPNLDCALDKGLISITDDGRLLISSRLREADRKALGIKSGMRLRFLVREQQVYLRYHRNEVFKA